MAVALQRDGFHIHRLSPAPPMRTLYMAHKRHVTTQLGHAIAVFQRAVEAELPALRSLLKGLHPEE
jgi:hypothetical protein